MDTAETIFYFCKSQMWWGLQVIFEGVRSVSKLQCGQEMSDINNMATKVMTTAVV